VFEKIYIPLQNLIIIIFIYQFKSLPFKVLIEI
jgi:hypothetical protein